MLYATMNKPAILHASSSSIEERLSKLEQENHSLKQEIEALKEENNALKQEYQKIYIASVQYILNTKRCLQECGHRHIASIHCYVEE